MKLQWPGCEADRPSPSNVVVKNEWNHIFTLPLCLHGMERDDCHFTVSFILILIHGHFTVLYYTLRACKFLLYNKSLVERSHIRFHRKCSSTYFGVIINSQGKNMQQNLSHPEHLYNCIFN